MSKDKKNKGRAWKAGKVIAIFIIIVGVLGVAILTYGYSLLNLIEQKPLVTKDPESGEDVVVDSSDLMITDNIPKSNGVTNIILFGVDSRESGGAGRSDSMMIATIDGKNNQVKLTSIMRDLYVPIPGRQEANRINTGYVFGGPTLAIQTINSNFNMNIENYASVDFVSFTKIIDILGGVEITITDGEANIVGLPSAGTYNLTGEQALSYARIRKIGNDHARTARQREILSSLFKKSKSLSALEIPGILNEILPLIETNLSKNEIISLGWTAMMSNSKEIEQFRIPVEGAYTDQYIRGMAVLVPDMEKNISALHEFIYGTNYAGEDSGYESSEYNN